MILDADGVPDSDLPRAEFAATGPANIAEFGSVRTPEGYRIPYAASSVHHLRRAAFVPLSW